MTFPSGRDPDDPTRTARAARPDSVSTAHAPSARQATSGARTEATVVREPARCHDGRRQGDGGTRKPV
ncbi:hypothetical protein APS67_004859 [Streptomyces sp. AVP053U2]|nr:hypothetical protein APS67_004859 [Streptomyces sp. AVP053U2]